MNTTCSIGDTSCAPWASCLVDDYFPCSQTILGNLFLILVYGYLLARGSKLLADGSELLMEILDPGFIGGFLLPVLGALPDSAIIFVSGLSSNAALVKEEILVGMGTLAGSTIMLLTVAWGAGVLVGRCNLGANGQALDQTLTRSHRFSLTQTGVTCEDDLKINSRIMMATSLSYFLIQGIAFKHLSADPMDPKTRREESPFILTTFIVAGLVFIVYSGYAVFNTTLQKKRLEAAKKKYLLDKLADMFHETIVKKESFITAPVEIEEESADSMHTGLLNSDPSDSEDWRNQIRSAHIDDNVLKIVGSWRKNQAHIDDGADEEMKGDEIEEETDTKMSNKQILTRSLLMMGFGTVIIVIFSSPMVDVISVFSLQIGVPAFYVSFVVTPFVSNASEVIASVLFASKKRKKNISLSFGAIYGAVTMNNTMCLTVFLIMIYVRGLVWEFSAEVVSILFVVFLMGSMTSFRTTFKTWEAFLVLSFYPLSLGVVMLLRDVVGWK